MASRAFTQRFRSTWCSCVGSPRTVQSSFGTTMRTCTCLRNVSVGDLLQIAEKMLHLHLQPLAFHPARKGKDLPHHIRGPMGAGFDDGDEFLALVVREAALQEIQRHDDRPEHVIQVMGDATGQSADLFHALGAEELLLELFSSGDVRIDLQIAARVARLISQQSPAAIDRNSSSGFRHILQLAAPLSVLAKNLLRGMQLHVIRFEHFDELPPCRLALAPSIDALGGLVPEADFEIEVTDKNSVTCLVDKSCLIGDSLRES